MQRGIWGIKTIIFEALHSNAAMFSDWTGDAGLALRDRDWVGRRLVSPEAASYMTIICCDSPAE
jgi:hypothetical protein